jgi:hypothetical protein
MSQGRAKGARAWSLDQGMRRRMPEAAATHLCSSFWCEGVVSSAGACPGGSGRRAPLRQLGMDVRTCEMYLWGGGAWVREDQRGDG